MSDFATIHVGDSIKLDDTAIRILGKVESVEDIFKGFEEEEKLIRALNLRLNTPAPPRHFISWKGGRCYLILIEGVRNIRISLLDITELAEERRRSEETADLLKSTINILDDALLIAKNDIIVEMNHQAEKILGKVKGKNLSNLGLTTGQIKADGRLIDVKLQKSGEYTVVLMQDITELSLLREDYKKRRELYHAIFRSSPDLIYVTTLDGEVVDVTPNVEAILGYRVDEFRYLNAQDMYVNPDDRRRFLEELLKNGFIKNFEVVYKKKNGEPVYCLESATLLEKDLIVGFIRDVTTLIEYQRKIEELGERYRTLLDNLPVGILLIRDGKIIYGNPALEIITGYSLTDFVGRKFESLANRIFGGLAFEDETEVPFKGKEKSGWAIVSFTPLSSNEKVCTIVDVTEIKKAHEELLKSESLLKSLFNSISDPIFYIAPDKTILMQNTAALNLFGSCIMRKCNEVLKASCSRCILETSLRRKTSESKLYTLSGKTYEVFSFPVVIKNRVSGAIIHMRDVTTKLRVEEELKKKNAVLEAIIKINKVIVREKDPKRIVEEACTYLGEIKDYTVVWGTFMQGDHFVGVPNKKIPPELLTFRLGDGCIALEEAVKSRRPIYVRCITPRCMTCAVMKKFKHKYDFAIPLAFKEKMYGILVVSTLKPLTDDEIEIFSSMGEDLSFAIYSKEVEKQRVEALNQLKSNLAHFEYLSDRLRNPISVILGYLEMEDELGSEQVLKVVKEQTKRMMKILEELRKEEVETYDVLKMF